MSNIYQLTTLSRKEGKIWGSGQMKSDNNGFSSKNPYPSNRNIMVHHHESQKRDVANATIAAAVAGAVAATTSLMEQAPETAVEINSYKLSFRNGEKERIIDDVNYFMEPSVLEEPLLEKNERKSNYLSLTEWESSEGKGPESEEGGDDVPETKSKKKKKGKAKKKGFLHRLKKLGRIMKKKKTKKSAPAKHTPAEHIPAKLAPEHKPAKRAPKRMLLLPAESIPLDFLPTKSTPIQSLPAEFTHLERAADIKDDLSSSYGYGPVAITNIVPSSKENSISIRSSVNLNIANFADDISEIYSEVNTLCGDEGTVPDQIRTLDLMNPMTLDVLTLASASLASASFEQQASSSDQDTITIISNDDTKSSTCIQSITALSPFEQDAVTIISNDDTKFTIDDEATTLNVPAFQGDLWTLLYGKKKKSANTNTTDGAINVINQTSLDKDNDGKQGIEQQQETKYNKYRDLQTPIKLNIANLPSRPGVYVDFDTNRQNEYSILETF